MTCQPRVLHVQMFKQWRRSTLLLHEAWTLLFLVHWAKNIYASNPSKCMGTGDFVISGHQIESIILVDVRG